MRGYFGIGIEGVSKPMNAGNLMRSAHAFGASFVFTIDAHARVRNMPSDTSDTPRQVPAYHWRSVDELILPRGCRLVGVELLDDAVDLPSFRHPMQAAYVMGPERGHLSAAMLARCQHVIKIPTSFCINVATAGAIVMYDRVRTLGRHAPRAEWAGGAPGPAPQHVHGPPIRRRAEG